MIHILWSSNQVKKLLFSSSPDLLICLDFRLKSKSRITVSAEQWKGLYLCAVSEQPVRICLCLPRCPNMIYPTSDIFTLVWKTDHPQCEMTAQHIKSIGQQHIAIMQWQDSSVRIIFYPWCSGKKLFSLPNMYLVKKRQLQYSSLLISR